MSELDAVRKIGEVVVGTGGQSNIDFSNIDQRYRHLQLVFNGRSTAASTQQGLYLRFNSDAGANYDVAGRGIWSNTGAVETHCSTGGTSAFLGVVNAASSAGQRLSSVIVDIPQYAGSVYSKACLSRWANRSGSGGVTEGTEAQGWSGTAAITQVTLILDAGNFDAGSVASLYGLR